IKNEINEYYMREFELEEQKINEDDEIDLAYTEDDCGMSIQITTIINKRVIYVYEDNIKIKEFYFNKKDYLYNIENLDFGNLIDFRNW
ncbi:MAG: hypothetical protein ACRCZ9_08595, partial [Fusobacteriaceae bacterium]